MTELEKSLWARINKCLLTIEKYLDERDQARIDVMPEIIFYDNLIQEILKKIHELNLLADSLAMDFRRLYNESQEIYCLDKKMANKLADIGRKYLYECQCTNDKVRLLYYEISQLNASWRQLLIESDYWETLALNEINQAEDLRGQIEKIKTVALNQAVCK